MMRKAFKDKEDLTQSGAALITTIMIGALLSIASIALLTSVGSNSRNTTDVLNESKAYYGAESGLQATINVLRNTTGGLPYSTALAAPNLSSWITYNCPAQPSLLLPLRVSIGSNPCDTNLGTSYQVAVSDPDNTQASLTFSTVGGFTNTGVASVSYPSESDPDRVTLSVVNVSNCLISFTAGTHCAPNPTDPNSLLGTLRIEKVGAGAVIPHTIDNPLLFAINYTITAPRVATKTMRAKVTQASATDPIVVTFDSDTYGLMGTTIKICQTSTTTNPCPAFSTSISLPVTPGTTDVPFYMNTTPVEPYRLKILSTGYGPNGAKKQLEGIVQKNFFNDLAGPAAIMMQGTGDGLLFDPGDSSVFEIVGEDGTTGNTIPSVGVIDQEGLDEVEDGIPNNNDNITPAPAVVTDLPDWMTTPQQLDDLVSLLRQTAQNSGRYFLNPTTNLNNTGNFADGTGITFCEGDCTAGVDGGGIMVVTGQLTNVGGWSFKGLIIVTGSGGWLRNGGGNGTVIGNVVIAPYGDDQLASNTFSLPPQYEVTGGGTSDVAFDGIILDDTFDGTSAISNFMLGVAEK
jgi:Tfp pilus assembly protein PilX